MQRDADGATQNRPRYTAIARKVSRFFAGTDKQGREAMILEANNDNATGTGAPSRFMGAGDEDAQRTSN